MDSIGNRLFELRKKQGITQEKLAEQLNVSRQSVSNWELDKSLPDTDKLFVLAQIYDVSLDYIAFGNKNVIDEMQEPAQNIALHIIKDCATFCKYMVYTNCIYCPFYVIIIN